MGKASMSFLTALSLSFNNLRTKKARTILTSFAGSIGIIGIALILSISTGVKDYIRTMEEETLSQYPLQIQSEGFDLMSMMGDMSGAGGDKKDPDKVNVVETITNLFSKVESNDLQSLKHYLDSDKSGIKEYTNSIEYKYDITPQIFRVDGDKVRQVNPDKSFDALGGASGTSGMMLSMMGTEMFYEMPEDPDLYRDQYQVKAGRWPEAYNECVVVLTGNGSISDTMLYTLGLRDSMELDDMIRQFSEGETVDTPDDLGTYNYDDLVGIPFKLVNSGDYYTYDSQYQVWTDKSDDEKYMKDLVEHGEDLTIVGVVQPEDENSISVLSSGIGYLPSLTTHVIENADQCRIVKEQLKTPKRDVFSGEAFGDEKREMILILILCFRLIRTPWNRLFNLMNRL